MQTIHYRVTGNTLSSLCLVFVHGMLCNQQNWLQQIAYFKSQYQVLTLDLPGHGKSVVQPKQQWDIRSLALDLKQFLTELKLNKPFILIGHSASVRIVLELNSILNREEVAGLVLIDCGYQTLISPDTKQWSADLRQRGYVKWLTQFFTSKFGLGEGRLRESILKSALEIDPAIGESLYLAVKTYDYYTLDKCLKLTAVPVLVLQSCFYKNGALKYASSRSGDQSEWLDLIKLTVPKAQLEVIPHCGHWIMIEQPDSCNQRIEHFIQHLNVSPTTKRSSKKKENALPSDNFDLPL